MSDPAENGLSATAGAWRAAFWIAVAGGFVLALWPEPHTHEPWFAGADKVKHAASFALLVLLGLRAGYRSLPRLVLGLMALGGAVEIAQSFTDTRSAEWLDWLADGVGIALGLSLAGVRAHLQRTSPALEQEHRR